MIEATSVTCMFGDNIAVGDADLTIHPGEVVGLVGPNGSGKTTLLRALYHSITPAGGRVVVDEQALGDMSRRDIARAMAVVVQEREAQSEVTVAETVSLGRLPHLGFAASLGVADHAAVDEAMATCAISHLADRPMGQLSGGERQRVLIARALAQKATHILLDEPTNHLDLRYQHEVLDSLTGLSAGVGIVLHDLNLANTYCDRVVVLKNGRVITTGTPAEVLVPEVLEPVYGVPVQRVEVHGRWHLLLGAGAAA